jgi:hypothetical protein
LGSPLAALIAELAGKSPAHVLTPLNCTPTSAQGHSTIIAWHYDHQHYTMVPQSQPKTHGSPSAQSSRGAQKRELETSLP